MKRHAHRSPLAPVLSETRRIVAGCSHKRCYPKAEVAKRLAKGMRRQLDRCKVEAYHCQHCHNWHIGEL